jgi:hypothetical protein
VSENQGFTRPDGTLTAALSGAAVPREREISAPNRQLVGRNGIGKVSIAVPSVVMTRDEALAHAAWLVAIADDHDEFAAYLTAVRST